MRISSITLNNFKRFTNLRIENIPQEAKLVLLIGSNGSGKSCVFDAFRFTEHNDPKELTDYYNKDNSVGMFINIETYDQNGSVFLYDNNENGNRANVLETDSFYGRTSFRHVSRLKQYGIFTEQSLGGRDSNIPKIVELKYQPYDKISREPLFIDTDYYFERAIENISKNILNDLFREQASYEQIRQKYVQPLNNAFKSIFGSDEATTLSLVAITPPLEGNPAQIKFNKGKSEIHYNLLSAGEKAVVNILFDLLVVKNEFKNTIYYIDELDLHLNTKLQYNFLKEITENWIPENCQLWTASHSLGFIDYARECQHATILDFDNFDFDSKQIISPSDKKDYQIFEITVGRDFIDKVFRGSRIIFAENTDTTFYNDLAFSNTFFFNANDKHDVFHKAINLKLAGLIDRDFLTDEEIEEIKSDYSNIKILPYYNFENLIFHPDNLEEYYQKENKPFDKEDYIRQIKALKNSLERNLIYGIAGARSGYPFFKENDAKRHEKLNKFRESKDILSLIGSDEFEDFYKVFNAKEYGKDVKWRQNLQKKELAKTNWFKTQIEKALDNDLIITNNE